MKYLLSIASNDLTAIASFRNAAASSDKMEEYQVNCIRISK